VADLREGDFAVLEDGVPQRVFLFEREQVPVSLVLMIDASGSMTERLRAAKEAARLLVRTIRPQDRAQVVGFAERTWLAQDFTADQPLIEGAIRGIHGYGQTALRNALYDVLRRGAGPWCCCRTARTRVRWSGKTTSSSWRARAT